MDIEPETEPDENLRLPQFDADEILLDIGYDDEPDEGYLFPIGKEDP